MAIFIMAYIQEVVGTMPYEISNISLLSNEAYQFQNIVNNDIATIM